ncbi:hypothetical protein N0V91_006764 [Didymella pomorum]|uniref:Uncharacterized protein n=1 Tax=Didymella pomorum TaxID=749634 RepID=A0A9W8ZCM8_9PLEO|nr:hypothetical protein N0V91_006764 [Didymella pomorum]
MRFSHFSIFALSGLALASPVVQKRDTQSDVASLLTDLYATVQIYTGAINATLAPLSASSGLLEKTAATAEVGAQINKITAAVTSTTNEIKALPPVNSTTEKRSIEIDEVINAQPEKRQLIAVSAILALIIVEIFATVTAAVAILGLAGLLIFLNPLTGAISALILAVQLILDIVLVGVIALLNGLLTALALGVSGL